MNTSWRTAIMVALMGSMLAGSLVVTPAPLVADGSGTDTSTYYFRMMVQGHQLIEWKLKAVTSWSCEPCPVGAPCGNRKPVANVAPAAQYPYTFKANGRQESNFANAGLADHRSVRVKFEVISTPLGEFTLFEIHPDDVKSSAIPAPALFTARAQLSEGGVNPPCYAAEKAAIEKSRQAFRDSIKRAGCTSKKAPKDGVVVGYNTGSDSQAMTFTPATVRKTVITFPRCTSPASIDITRFPSLPRQVPNVENTAIKRYVIHVAKVLPYTRGCRPGWDSCSVTWHADWQIVLQREPASAPRWD